MEQESARMAARALGLAALLAAGTACGPPPRVDPGAFQTAVAGPAAGRLASLESLVAFGEVDLVSGGRRFSGRVRALYVRPHRLRIDLELPGFFGMLGGGGTLWAGESAIWWRSSSDPDLHRGAADPVFAPLLGRVARLRDLEVLLFGLPAWWLEPGPSGWPGITSRLGGDPPSGQVTQRWSDGWSETATIGGRPPVIHQLVRRDPHGVRVRVRFDRHKSLSGIELATRADVRSPVQGGELHLRWRRFETDLPDARARLQWPR